MDLLNVTGEGNSNINRSQLWVSLLDDSFEVRIMGVLDGYVVFRRPRCAPLIKGCKDFLTSFKIKENE